MASNAQIISRPIKSPNSIPTNRTFNTSFHQIANTAICKYLSIISAFAVEQEFCVAVVAISSGRC